MAKKKKRGHRKKMKKTGNIIRKIKNSSVFILFLLRHSLLCGFFSGFFAVSVYAAQVKVEATVDRNQMGIGDSFILNVSVVSEEDFELTEPQLAKVPGLEVINAAPGGRQSSSSMSIVNGKTQFTQRTIQDYNFTLSPQKEGTFLIPGVDVNIAGQTYKSNPIKIEVGDEFRNSRPQPKGRPQFPPGFGGSQQDGESGSNPLESLQDDEDLFEQLLKQQQRIFGGGGFGGGFGQPPATLPNGQIPSKKLNINTEEAFFVYLDLDKNEAYESEQITAKWYIYTRANIESLDRVKFPDLRGFWKEIIEEVPALQFSEEIVNGVRYRKALLASHALFPIKSGTAVIDEFRVKAKVRTQTQFGWGGSKELSQSSRRTEIKVLPLPQEGRTKGFSGAVGNYHITLKAEATHFPAHQPFSIKVRYEGIGNAKLIDLPTIFWPEGLEVYDTKSDAKFFKDGQSYKEFEILVIPRKEGELKIPALELTYFDPKEKKYISTSTQELTLQITPGSPNSITQSGGTGRGTGPNTTNASSIEALFKHQPILELPTSNFSFAVYRLPFYFFTLLLGLTGLLLHFLWQLKNIKNKPQIFIDVKNKISLIDKYQNLSDQRKVGAEATNLIYLLVANLAGQQKADQEIHLLINEITSKDQQLYLQRIMQLFDYFQLIGFSPDEIKAAALNKKPIKEQIEQLRILAEEIVAKLKKQDKDRE